MVGAPQGNINAMGNSGGKSLQDRKLSAKVRTKALNDIYAVLNADADVESWSDYKKQVVLKLAGTVLPRLNELSGKDGGPIEIDDFSNLSNEELERRIQASRGGEDKA